jgi:hypothetical protein
MAAKITRMTDIQTEYPDIESNRMNYFNYHATFCLKNRTQKCPDIEIFQISGVRLSDLDCTQ